MKLLTITIDYLPMPGGVARYTDMICEAFGSDMSVVADLRDGTGSNSHAIDRPFDVSYRSFMQSKWPRWMGAVHELAKHNVDLVITHHVLPLGVAALMNKRRTNTDYVVVLHGMDFELATRNVWKRWITKQVLREAKEIVTNTHVLASRVKKFVDREPIVIHPRPYVASAESIETDTFNILSVGRLVERKGMQRVLEALTKIPHLQNKIRYRIVGGAGDHEAALRSLVDQYNLNEIVSFDVDVDDTTLQRAYQEADVFVLPTLSRAEDREGFGIVYHEAAQFGVPSIATDMPGVDEAVINGETGLLVSNDEELVDSITTLIHNHELRATLGNQAKQHVEQSANMTDNLKRALGL